MPSERTPLRGRDASPQYVFMTSPNRIYRNKVRQFQCCICAGLLAIFVTAVVITVSYSVNHDIEDLDGNTTNMSDIQTLLTLSWPLADKKEPKWEVTDDSDLEVALEAGREALKMKDLFEAASPSLAVATPAYRHQKTVSTSPQARLLARSGYIMDLATKKLAILRGKNKTIGRGPTVSADWLPQDVCGNDPGLGFTCPATPFRTADGSCNNLQHPVTWGVALRPFRRVMPADYGDGVSSPRKAFDGSELPTAREVSVTVHRPMYHDDPKFTVMLAVWGQFLDHDITATALSQGVNGSAISCCYAVNNPALKMNPECFPVRLAQGDPFYDMYNITCMEFVRSAPAPTCSFGPREQMNQASSYIDGSVVYGTTTTLMSILRSYSGGRLRMSLTPDGRELLPYSTDPNDGCNSEVERLKGRYCFMSGDARANENLHLTTMHLILARQHNKIADKLTVLNPLWSDERLFQETRRIISAQMQHISYNEFLSIILGPQLMDQLELSPKSEGYYDNYNASVDATIANNFATASFRFAHSLLPGLMKMLGNDTSSEEYVEMHKMLFNPYGLYQMGFMDKTVRGALETHVLKVDPYFSKEITQHLFEQSTPMGKGPCGLDLVSLNIQRGRDHGLRSYPYWREYCGFPRPKLFSDLNGVMDPEVIERISSIYKTVDDIDMYTGVLSEIPLDDGILGPTVTCLLTDQFIRLKQGDRFWYETSQQPQAFTPEQLTELRKTTLAQMICDNSDEVMAVQPMVMRSIGPGNERVNCSDLSRPDWGAWKELPGGSFQRAGITRVQLFEGATVVTVKAAGKSKKLALGATVTGGSITGPSGTIWSGDLPVNIHLPLFDTVAGPEETTSPDDPPPVYGHGIMWDGDLTADETGIATFSGTYSKPTYVHGTALANFSIKWSSGNFNIKMKLLWNNTKNGTIDISGSYSSPLFLKAVKPKVMMTDSDLAKYTVNSVAASTSGVLRAPLILHGTFSPDRTSFIWSGNATLIIPSPPPPPPPTSALWSDGTTPVETQFLLKESAAAGIVTTFPKKNAFGATVTGGSVQTASGSLWSGTIPVDIPLPLFDAVAGPGVVSTPMDPPPVYGHGIIWDGTLSADASGLAHFRGTFSMPKFIHGTALTNFSIKWTSGNFDLTMQLLWNSTKNATVDLSGSFTSPVLLRQRKPVLMSSGKASYMVEDAISADASGMSMSAPLILYGDFSPDRTSFKWYGNVTLLIPTLVPTPVVSAMAYNTDPGMTLLAAKPKSRMAVGVSVLSGSVTAGSDSSSPVTWWSGDLPAAIPVHPFDKPSAVGMTSKKAMALPTFGGGITWNGKLSSDGAGGASLTGTFSMPFFTHGSPLNFSIQWWTGEFALQLRYLWNTTLDGVIETGKEYSSPIFFRAMKTPLLTKTMVEKYETDGLKVGPIDNNMQFIMAAEEALSAAPKVPIVLLGSYSPDKSVFWWSGAAVVSAPLPPPPVVPMQLSSKASKPSSRTKPINPTIYQSSAMLTPAPVRSLKATNGKVGFTVVSGWLATGAGTLWDGTIPITIPLPAFDSVATLGDSGLLAAPPVYGHGVVWKGNLSPTSPLEADVQGTFSLPSFVHGGTPNFSVSWTDGEFSLHAKLMWNASLAGLIDPDITYTSPIFFQGIKPMTEKSSIDTTPVEHVMEQLAANIDGIANPAVRVPMILQGTFAPDKTAFYWGGNVIASFSKSRSLPYLQKTDANSGAKMQQTAFSAKKDLALINGPMSPIIRLGATVLSGSVTSGWSTWWDGSLPVTIPIPAFDSFSFKQAGTVGAAPMVYGHGVTWQGSITSSTPDEVSLEGSFSLPKYIHAPWPTNFSIEWIEGQFSLRMKLLWNASLDGEVVPDRIFSSPVYFSGGSPADNARVLLAGVELSDEASALQMAAESLEVTGAAARAPIILQGTYTPDRTSLLWSGNVFVSIPRMTAGPLLVQAAVKPGKGGKKTDDKGGAKDAKGGKFGGKDKKPAAATKPTGGAIGFTAITGIINANFTPPPTPPPPVDDSNSTENVTLPPPLTYFSVWTGVTPMNLPVPFFNVSGTDPTADPVAVAALTISWNGTLTLTAAGAVNLEGEYSLPLEMHQVLGNMTVAWSGGTFSLEAQQLWKAAVAGMVQPGVTYTSPVFYRSTTPSTDDPVVNAATGKAAAKATGPAAPGAATKVPIILQGTFSPDNSQFIWAGNALLIFPWPA